MQKAVAGVVLWVEYDHNSINFVGAVPIGSR
jgi:hypothetical protein